MGIKKEAGKIRECESLNLTMLPPLYIPVKSRQPVWQVVASTHLVAVFIKEPYVFAISVTGYQPVIDLSPHQGPVT